MLAVSAAAHDEHLQLSFAETVQLVARASREAFRPLKTFRIELHPSREYWYNVTNALPGAATCRIFEHPRLVYRCEWSRGKQTLERLSADIAAALGEGWKRVQRSSTLVRLEPANPVRDPAVDVHHRPSGVEVTFYRPAGRDSTSRDGIE